MAKRTILKFIKNAPISTSQRHTLYNTRSRAAQADYWLGKASISRETSSISITSGAFVVNGTLSTFEGVNYMAAKLSNYSDKWYYYFVDRIEPSTPDLVRIYYTVDVMQTYLFDIINGIQPSLVVQEHTNRFNSDGSPKVIRTNEVIQPRDMEIARLDRASSVKGSEEQYLRWIVIHSKYPLLAQGGGVLGTEIPLPRISGQETSFYQYYMPFDIRNPDKTITLSFDDGGNISAPKSIRGFIEAIKSSTEGLFKKDSLVLQEVKDMIPFEGVESYKGGVMRLTGKGIGGLSYKDKYTDEEAAILYPTDKAKKRTSMTVVSRDDKYQGLKGRDTEPRLLGYPYTQALAVTPTGHTMPIQLEDFDGDGYKMKLKTNLDHMNSNQFYPYGYRDKRGSGLGHIDGITYNTNVTIDYIDNHAAEMVRSTMNVLMSSAIPGGIMAMSLTDNARKQQEAISKMQSMGAPVEDIRDAKSEMHQTMSSAAAYKQSALRGAEEASIMALSANFGQARSAGVTGVPGRGINQGTAADEFHVIVYQPSSESIKEIEWHFHRFGYRVNEVKKPNFWSRKHFNYVKVSAPHVIGKIPQNHINEIEGILSSGITFWHTEDVGNYRLSNGEV